MFIDSATIHVRSGRGGAGAVTFRREKYVPKGGPDGGDGGDGGSVVLVADAQVTTLLDFAGRHHWHAKDGQPGRSRQQHGADGEDLFIAVPPGTMIHDHKTAALIADLDQTGRSLTVARGGRGGWGNEHFKSATNQTPTQATAGEPAVELNLRLELKLVADVGLVGKPNAGKSTLLSRISNARPKVGAYPFTTLAPQPGIASLPGAAQAGEVDGGRRLVVADIPGLIEHAHEGQGLGVRFLRHIERTRLLMHLIEVEPGDGSDPVNNYEVIRRELTAYSSTLAARPQVIALSKMDLLASEADRAAAVEMIEEALGQPVIPISAATGEGVERLLEACWAGLDRHTEDAAWPMAGRAQPQVENGSSAPS